LFDTVHQLVQIISIVASPREPYRDRMTNQTPIQSGFGSRSTAAEVLGGRSLEGTIAIVTGGYAGIGLETTRALAGAGATVIVPARSHDKARAALADVPRVELAAMELMAPASVDAFAAAFLATGRPLHLLINNAGIMAAPLQRDARGFESQLATNHIGHFQLTVRLLPALRRAAGARVVALSSRGHQRSPVDFEDPHFHERPYDRWVAYGQSKTANALFARGLDARGAADDIRSFAVHPGGIITELSRHMTKEELAATASTVRGGLKTPEQGAATTAWAATSPQLAGMGGVYCEDCDIATAVPADFAEGYGVKPWACDPALADRLWTLSESWL